MKTQARRRNGQAPPCSVIANLGFWCKQAAIGDDGRNATIRSGRSTVQGTTFRPAAPLENSVSSQMPSNERGLKAQTPQGLAGSEGITGFSRANSGDWWSQARGNARSGALLPRKITAPHSVQAARRS